MFNKKAIENYVLVIILLAALAIGIALAIIFVLKEKGISFIDFFNDLFRF